MVHSANAGIGAAPGEEIVESERCRNTRSITVMISSDALSVASECSSSSSSPLFTLAVSSAVRTLSLDAWPDTVEAFTSDSFGKTLESWPISSALASSWRRAFQMWMLAASKRAMASSTALV